MFGNMQGWVISAVMLIASVGMLYVMALPPKESRWEKKVPLAFKPVVLPVSPDTVRPAGTADCDAGELYRKAIEEYLSSPKIYKDAPRVNVSKLPAVAIIVQATECGKMRLFENNPTKAINYDNRKAWVEALMALGQATNDVGLQYRESEPKKATQYYEAAFMLGRRLFDERVTWDEMNKGLSIMTMSVGQLAKIADNAKDGARVDVLSNFATEVQQYHSDLQDTVASPLSNPVESYGSKYAGDVFAAAKTTTVDRVWRVEAILHLGHYRWNVVDERKGDQRWAAKELQLLDASGDPKNTDFVVRTAVKAALDLTLDQQRLTGSGQ